jgi:hypothetical protein
MGGKKNDDWLIYWLRKDLEEYYRTYLHNFNLKAIAMMICSLDDVKLDLKKLKFRCFAAKGK